MSMMDSIEEEYQDKIEKLQAKIGQLKKTLTEIALENDPVFPSMRHCKVCGGRDVGVMGHALNCKYEQALKG